MLIQILPGSRWAVTRALEIHLCTETLVAVSVLCWTAFNQVNPLFREGDGWTRTCAENNHWVWSSHILRKSPFSSYVMWVFSQWRSGRLCVLNFGTEPEQEALQRCPLLCRLLPLGHFCLHQDSRLLSAASYHPKSSPCSPIFFSHLPSWLQFYP